MAVSRTKRTLRMSRAGSGRGWAGQLALKALNLLNSHDITSMCPVAEGPARGAVGPCPAVLRTLIPGGVGSEPSL